MHLLSSLSASSVLALFLLGAPSSSTSGRAVPPERHVAPSPRVVEAVQRGEVIGIGGGAGGKYGGRWKGRETLAAHGLEEAADSIERGLSWLAENQAEDGSWEGDLDATSLALLALLGDGHTTTQGSHAKVTTRGLAWLRAQQVRASGSWVEASGDEALGNDARATLAIVEAYHFSKSPLLKVTAEKAVGALRKTDAFDDEPTLEAARSRAWVVLALVAAEEARLQVRASERREAAAWFAGLSQRLADSDDVSPRAGEAHALCVITRVSLGQDPAEAPELDAHGELLLRIAGDSSPLLDPAGWFHGSAAQHQLGREAAWTTWARGLRSRVLERQRSEGEHAGSWDPAGADSSVGRIRATALACLALETPYRHARVFGAR